MRVVGLTFKTDSHRKRGRFGRGCGRQIRFRVAAQLTAEIYDAASASRQKPRRKTRVELVPRTA
ncbi:MAG: hypothetical protein R3D33_00105 [Hyphomicrobiaceae bacterium]